MYQQKDKINCPLGFGKMTREDCYECEYYDLGTCPVGISFSRNNPEDRHIWEPYLVSTEVK